MPKRLSQQEIENLINSTGETFVTPQVYLNAFQHLQIKCQKCSGIYTKQWCNFCRGSRCPICAEDSRTTKRKLSFETVRNLIKNGGDCLLSSPEAYKNNRSLLLIRCGKCNIEYSKNLEDFTRKDKPRKCNFCSDQQKSELFRLSEADVIKICAENRLKLLSPYSEYQNMRQTLQFECNACQFIFSTNLDSIKTKKTGCPKCKSSFDERSIMNLLERLEFNGGIKGWKREHRFSNDIDETMHKLSYDFLIETGDCDVLVEFDGIQHFSPTGFSHSSDPGEEFKSTNKRDRIKMNIVLKFYMFATHMLSRFEQYMRYINYIS